MSRRPERIEVLLLLLFTFWLRVCDSIRLEAVLVPQFRFRGQNATLLCKYELEPAEELFSLKWYKEDTEFYRFTPPAENSSPPRYSQQRHERREYGKWNHQDGVYDSSSRRNEQEQQKQHINGEVQAWPVPGIKINLRDSLPQRVELKKVTFKSSGVYRCEVTAAVRSTSNGYGYSAIQKFKMKESVNRMTVVELPPRKPYISGGRLQPEYKPGDILNLTCSSAPSNPPSQLEWILNGRMVPGEYLLGPQMESLPRGLYQSTLGLLLPLEPKHFGSDGEIRVKCKGTIEAEFWENETENSYHQELVPDKDKSYRVLEVQETRWPASSSTLVKGSFLMVGLSVLLFACTSNKPYSAVLLSR